MMPAMRTTLTTDDELMPRIEELRRREGLSFKAAINRLLEAGQRSEGEAVQAVSHRTEPRRPGLRAELDPVKLNQLVDEIEADAFVGSHSQ